MRPEHSGTTENYQRHGKWITLLRMKSRKFHSDTPEIRLGSSWPFSRLFRNLSLSLVQPHQLSSHSPDPFGIFLPFHALRNLNCFLPLLCRASSHLLNLLTSKLYISSSSRERVFSCNRPSPKKFKTVHLVASQPRSSIPLGSLNLTVILCLFCPLLKTTY